MLVLLVGSAGALCAVLVTRKFRKEAKFRNQLHLPDTPVLSKVALDSRRALLIAHGIMRKQMCQAFLSTSKQYAPVPLSFCKGIIGSYWSILGTAVGGSLIVVAFGRVVIDRFKHHRELEAAIAEDKENVAVGAIEAVGGLTLYTLCKAAWGSGPLRGGLSVFGASPELDRCASQERYLAEKLAEMSHAALGGAASLVHLSQLQVSDKDVADSVGSLIAYAKRSVGAANILVAPEIPEAWDSFSSRLAAHRKEMRGLANKIYYPTLPGASGAAAHKALLMVNATEPVVKFARGSKDCSNALAWLVKELGSSQLSLFKSCLNSLVLGIALGTEFGSWLPIA